MYRCIFVHPDPVQRSIPRLSLVTTITARGTASCTSVSDGLPECTISSPTSLPRGTQILMDLQAEHPPEHQKPPPFPRSSTANRVLQVIQALFHRYSVHKLNAAFRNLPFFGLLCQEGIVNLTIDGKIEPAKPSCLCAHRFLPNLKSLGAQQSIMDRLHQVAAETKEILCESV